MLYALYRLGKICQMCNGKTSLFSRVEFCDNCKPWFSHWSQLMNDITKLQNMPDRELQRLRIFGRTPLIKLYSKLYNEFTRDGELDDDEIALLDHVQERFGLSREDVAYNDNVLPYYYVSYFRRTDQLPVPNLELNSPVILKIGEVAHYADHAVLKEMRVVNLGYVGGSRGVSIRIMKGVSYRVGSHRGHIVKEDQLVQTSSGILLMTNQRVLLIPTSGNKPVTIPLAKIQHYRCLENALEVYKEGREKGYFFIMTRGAVEIFGICLGAMLQRNGAFGV